MAALTLSERVESFLFGEKGQRWEAGTAVASNLFQKQVVVPITSLSVEKATTEQRGKALEVLADKYGIAANIQGSQSMGNIDVIRIAGESNLQKLQAAFQLSNIRGWQLNEVTRGGKTEQAINLRADALTDFQIKYLSELLSKWGIPNQDIISHSLTPQPSGIRVIRIEGAKNMERLYQQVPSLRTTDESGPLRPGSPVREARKNDC